jgi:DNA-binding NtrC family response regulator
MPKRVLVVDHNPSQSHPLEEAAARLGYYVAAADSADKALSLLKADSAGDICLTLLDLVTTGAGGLSILSAMRDLPRKPPVIVQTAHGDIDAATAAMRSGAVDFVVKPVSPERLDVSIKNALKIEALSGELVRIKAAAQGAIGFADLIAGSEAMTRVLDLGKRAADSTIPILIEGESGVGKELVARAVHGESARKSGPFVAVNCGAIPETAIESALFGHRDGKLVEAAQGTLFLDEIDQLPPDAQAKLLQILQDGEIRPAGAKQPVKVEMRLIAATSKNLIHLVNEGRFREDLYYQLNVFPIWVPPLRMRLEDVPELVRHFATRFAAEEGKRVDGVDPEAVAMLQRYSWPGNIRQLVNAVFRAVVLADASVLTVDEFPQIAAHVEGHAATVPPAPAPRDQAPRIDGPVMLGQSARTPLTINVRQASGKDSIGIPALSDSGDIRSLEAVEADMIRLAFGRYRGRMTEIARRLGIGRSTLYRKMREIGLEVRAH